MADIAFSGWFGRKGIAMKPMNSPKGSEIPIGKWLDQIGATKRFVGRIGDGPPDWEIQYRGDRSGVEVTLLQNTEGWGKTKEAAFERELERLIEGASKEGDQRWHARCEYDPREPKPPSRRDPTWKKRVLDALESPTGGEFQLLPDEDIRRRGVVLTLDPATNEGSFSGVGRDVGSRVVHAVTERIIACVEEKVEKIQKTNRACRYSQWWLVFDDEIVIAPIQQVLSVDERSRIESSVRDCSDTVRLSKVVLVSRFQMVPPPATQDMWFYAPWEDSRFPPLPPSP